MVAWQTEPHKMPKFFELSKNSVVFKEFLKLQKFKQTNQGSNAVQGSHSILEVPQHFRGPICLLGVPSAFQGSNPTQFRGHKAFQGSHSSLEVPQHFKGPICLPFRGPITVYGSQSILEVPQHFRGPITVQRLEIMKNFQGSHKKIKIFHLEIIFKIC